MCKEAFSKFLAFSKISCYNVISFIYELVSYLAIYTHSYPVTCKINIAIYSCTCCEVLSLHEIASDGLYVWARGICLIYMP